jgi:hypothetical protein
MHKRSALLGILLAGGIAVAGCSSPTPAATPQPGVPSHIGQPATNLAVGVTVTSVTVVPTIALNQSGYRPGSGYDAYTETPAGDGEKYVLVATHVTNNSQKAMDLACAAPLKTSAKDDQGHEYAPMDQLFKFKGNPQCDEAVEAGQTTDMTWIYRVPADAHMVGWEFQETNGGFFTLHRKDLPTLVELETPVT